MTKIYLVRHGVTDYNSALKLQGSSDIPLNSDGLKQADFARDYFKNVHIDRFLSSPLSRAYKTGETINENHQLPIKCLDDLMEQSFGPFEGDHIENIRLRYPEGDLPGAETPEELLNRARSVIDFIDRNYTDEVVIATAHSRIIKAILTLFTDEVDLVFTKLDNCSVSILESDGELYKVTDVNIKTH